MTDEAFEALLLSMALAALLVAFPDSEIIATASA